MSATACINANDKSAVYPLRPHHALCIRFFEGRGYSGEFTAHMQQMIDILNKGNAAVRLTCGGDVICSACPNLTDGSCERQGKASKIDSLCLNALKLEYGEIIGFKELSDLALKKIIRPGLQRKICADCTWAYICLKEAAD